MTINGSKKPLNLLPFNLKGHPVELKVRRKLELKPGNYNAKVGSQPDHPMIEGAGVEFVIKGLTSGREYKIRPVKVDQASQIELYLDFELTFDEIGSLGEVVQFKVFKDGRSAGPPHEISLTATTLQAGESAYLERAIRLLSLIK